MEKEKRRVSPSRVMFHVNSVAGCDMNTLRMKSRKREIVDRRKIAGYFLYKYSDMTYDEIAEYLNLKDHATIIHYCKMVDNLNGSDKFITESVFRIESRLIYDLCPEEKIKRDDFVSSVIRLIVWDEIGTTRQNLEDYYYNQLLIKREEDECTQV